MLNKIANFCIWATTLTDVALLKFVATYRSDCVTYFHSKEKIPCATFWITSHRYGDTCTTCLDKGTRDAWGHGWTYMWNRLPTLNDKPFRKTRIAFAYGPHVLQWLVDLWVKLGVAFGRVRGHGRRQPGVLHRSTWISSESYVLLRALGLPLEHRIALRTILGRQETGQASISSKEYAPLWQVFFKREQLCGTQQTLKRLAYS